MYCRFLGSADLLQSIPIFCLNALQCLCRPFLAICLTKGLFITHDADHHGGEDVDDEDDGR